MKFPESYIYWECIVGEYLSVRDMAIVECAITNSSLRQNLNLFFPPKNLDEYSYEQIHEYQQISPYRYYSFDMVIELSSAEMELWCNQRALKIIRLCLTSKYEPVEVDVGWACLNYVKHLEFDLPRYQLDFSMISDQLKSLESFSWKKYPNKDIESVIQELILCNDINIDRNKDSGKVAGLKSLRISFERWPSDNENSSKAIAIASFINLTTLDLNCGIGPRCRSGLSLVFEAIVKLPYLNSLSLSFVEFDHQLWNILRQLRHLTELSLCSNIFVDCLAIADICNNSSASMRRLVLRENQHLDILLMHTIFINLHNLIVVEIFYKDWILQVERILPTLSMDILLPLSKMLKVFDLISAQMHQLEELTFSMGYYSTNDLLIEQLLLNCKYIRKLDIRASARHDGLTRTGLQNIAKEYYRSLRYLGIPQHLYDSCIFDFSTLFARVPHKLEVWSSRLEPPWINDKL